MQVRRIAHLVTIALAVMLADWATKIWSQDALFVVFNDREASWWPVPLLFACTAAFLWISRDPLVTVGLGLLSGGWLANFIDRTFFGPVTDFIPLSLAGRHYYANLADAAIVSSLLFFGLAFARGALRRRAASPAAAQDQMRRSTSSSARSRTSPGAPSALIRSPGRRA